MSRRPLTLTDDERFLFNHYTNIYNEQLKSIDLMYNELKKTNFKIDLTNPDFVFEIDWI